MQKHAMLITAYKDFDLLYDMLRIYTQEYDMDCYVHIDKKVQIERAVIDRLRSLDNVTVIRKYRVNWGSYYHPLAFIDLMDMAAKKKYAYYHCISANTFVGRSKKEFYNFFDENNGKSFMEYVYFKDTESAKDLEAWYRYYHYPFLYDKKGKRAVLWNNFEMYFVQLQAALGIRRRVNFDYKGYLYCHLTSEVAEYVLDYIRRNRSYVKGIKYCHVGEEFFFQNIVMHSMYADKVINDSLIYDDWSPHRERPAILDSDDYQGFLESDKVFVRKIEDIPRSMELFTALRDRCCS